MNLLSRIHVSLWLLFSCIGIQAQDVSKTNFKLVKIHFEGLVNVSSEKANEASGLKIKQMIMLENLKKVPQHLLESGLFTSARLRYNYTGNDLEVTFTVVEAISSVPCLFDNFMWFSDEELYAAIRQQLPKFDGKATEGGEMIDVIRKSLDKLLLTKTAGYKVAYEMEAGRAHVFKAKGEAPLLVCSIQYQGVTAFDPTTLTTASKDLIGSEYSRLINRIIVRETIVPMYRQNGYLRIKMLPLNAKPDPNNRPKCVNGATLVLGLDEGIIYKWKGITWSGNQLLSTEKLNRLFPLKLNEVADGLKIDKGMFLTSQNYTDRGYLDAEVKPVPIFDEATQTVTFSISIIEGGQYSFGQLAVTGVPENVIKNFQERWGTLQGKPYDAYALQAFITQTSRENTSQIKLTQSASIKPTPNRETHLVDLRLEF